MPPGTAASSSSRILHFTAVGSKTQLIEIAEDDEFARSKRAGLIEEEDALLDRNLGVLDVGTKARNRAYQDRLDEVRESTKGYDAKMRREAVEAAESIMSIRDEYQKHIDEFAALLQREIHGAFDRIDLQLYPVQVDRVDVIEQGVNVFVADTVPTAIENQSGVVSRRLKKAYDAFDIEQQKEKKRESKFVDKANKFIQNTAQRFLDESSLMTASLRTLNDDVVDVERRACRANERKVTNASAEILSIRKIIKQENQIRASEDGELLDCVIETQQMLQKTVLEHFGSEEKENGDRRGGDVKFEKLDQAVEKRAERDRERAAAAAAAADGDGSGDAEKGGGTEGATQDDTGGEV